MDLLFSSGALIVAAVWLGASLQSWRFRRLVARDAQRLFALRGDGVAEGRLDLLPPPVRRYLEKVGATRHAPVRALRLRHGGTFRTSLDSAPRPIRGEQYLSADLPGFVWWGRIRMAPGLWVEARDACIGAEGNMLVQIESTFTLADGRGPAFDEGSLLRLLGELAWMPTAFLDERYIAWTPIDDRSARAALRIRGREVSALFRFGDDDLLAAVEAERPRGDGTSAPWLGAYADYRDVGGLVVPFGAGASWVVGGETTEYAHWTVDSIELERPMPFGENVGSPPRSSRRPGRWSGLTATAEPLPGR
jgi:hypothetical protein